MIFIKTQAPFGHFMRFCMACGPGPEESERGRVPEHDPVRDADVGGILQRRAGAGGAAAAAPWRGVRNFSPSPAGRGRFGGEIKEKRAGKREYPGKWGGFSRFPFFISAGLGSC